MGISWDAKADRDSSGRTLKKKLIFIYNFTTTAHNPLHGPPLSHLSHFQLCTSIPIDVFFFTNYYARNAIMDEYAIYGPVGDAREMFDEMPERNVITWIREI